MKRLYSIAAIVALSLSALFLVQCDSITGDAPTSITLEPATTDGSTVKVSWAAPASGSPDRYVVSFMETGTSSYVKLTPEPTTTTFVHSPAGKTGKYMVTAIFGSTEYNSATTPTTTPFATASMNVSELNATGNSGYGWDRTTGEGATYSMEQASNAASVDFYSTDFANGSSGPTYSVASPDLGPTDPGNVVPTGSWRVNSFSNLLTSESDPLPLHSNIAYFNYTDVSSTPAVLGAYTADGYYAMIRITSATGGTLACQTWFQMVKGLRLIQH